MSETPSLHVLLRKEEESWSAFARRMKEADGEVIVVLSSADMNFLTDEEERRLFLTEIAKLRYRIKLATKQDVIATSARGMGIRVIERTRELKKILRGHALAEEALRLFSPHLWRQFWRSRLQTMGVLSLPKVRVSILIGVSAFLFLFVIFRLLPSAEIRVWPRQDSVTQTTNIYLASSGAVLQLPPHGRLMPLIPITMKVHRSIAYDQISKQFIGSNAQVRMSVINKSKDDFELRKGTRLLNQAGMIFRLQESVSVPPGGSVTAKAKAENQDLYGEDIGERGNVPANLHWDFPGLGTEDQKLVYAINKIPATGGITASRKILQQKDLDNGRKRLEAELLATAKQLIEEERVSRNAHDSERDLEFLTKDDVIRVTFSDFILPTPFLGKEVQSVPVEGTLTYTMFAYDARAILQLLSDEMASHVREGRQIIQASLSTERLNVYVIAYSDELSWIKLTADLVGTEEYVLDPLTPMGAQFARKVREQTAGVEKSKAISIVKNLPEVERATIGIWPPWSRSLPPIPSHISVVPQ